VGLDHGGFDIFVTEDFLNGADVVAVLQKLADLQKLLGKPAPDGLEPLPNSSVVPFSLRLCARFLLSIFDSWV
jgi:hypothetical protein